MNVLPGDMRLAAELYECCYSCLERARMELRRDNIEEADRWVKEFQRCKRDLDELIRKKEEHDRLMEFVSEMQKKGINLALIVRGNYK
jgi:vacuolar-type H+-ATPase subunit E/Vma4